MFICLSHDGAKRIASTARFLNTPNRCPLTAFGGASSTETLRSSTFVDACARASRDDARDVRALVDAPSVRRALAERSREDACNPPPCTRSAT
jgi:hypothetical protein